MMAAVWGIGSQFQVMEGEGPGVFANIGSITNLKLPETTRDIQDATTLDSPNQTEEKMVTLKRRGDGSVTINHDPSEDILGKFEGYLDNGKLKTFRAIYPNGDDYIQFQAFVTGVDEGEITPDGLLTATITLSASGPNTRGTVTEG